MGLENVIILRISVRLTLKCEQKHIFYINKFVTHFVWKITETFEDVAFQ